MQRFNAGKIYRWRCGIPDNEFNYCGCDQAKPYWSNYIVLQTNSDNQSEFSHHNTVCCGDYIIPIAPFHNESIVVLTVSINPVVAKMHYESSKDGKLLLVEAPERL